MTGLISVAIVDDDPIVRSALSSYLRADRGLRVAHECADGEEALRLLTAHPVDVVVMDVRMPRLDGLSATRALRQAVPAMKILMLTSFDDDEAVRDALDAGANGFLLKDTSPAGLANAVRAVTMGSTVVSPSPISRLVKAQERPHRPASHPDGVGLSPREQETLALLCAAHSNTEIAQALCVSESTVKTHVSAIMTKLGVTSRLKAVVRAHELGLVAPGGMTGPRG